MFTIDVMKQEVRIYNDGILILQAKDISEINEIINALIYENEDKWEVELLENILYTINNNLSTTEVA